MRSHFLSIFWTKRKNGGKQVASNQTLSALRVKEGVKKEEKKVEKEKEV